MRARLLAAVFLLGCAAASALADDLPARQDPSTTGSKAAPTLEALRARWEARPGDILAGVRLQDAYRAAGKAHTAVSLFKASLAEAPDDLARSFLYGRIKGGSAGLGLMRAALKQNLGRADGKTDGLLDAWIAMAVVEVAAGHAAEAASAALRLTALRGKAEDWTYLAWIQEHLVGNSELAIDSYRRAIGAKPGHLRARNALTLLLAEDDAFDEAVKIARGSVALHPKNAGAQLHLGLVLGMSGDRKAAAQAYDRALACAGDDADTLAEIGAGYIDIEEQELALKALEKALGLDPEHAEALTSLGTVSLDMGDVSAAVRYLKKAARLRPKDAHVAYLQGVCAQRQGKHAAAVKAFKKASSLDPDSVEYIVVLALAYVKKGASGSAVPLFKKAIKLDPKDPELRLQLGIAYVKTRKHKLARTAFQEMAALAAKDPRPHYYLAILWGDRMGKTRQALAELEIYKRLGGKEPTALAWLEDLRAQLGKN